MFELLTIFGTNRYTIWGLLDVLVMFVVSTMQAPCSKHATLGTPLFLQSRPFHWVPIAIAPLVFLGATKGGFRSQRADKNLQVSR